MDERLLLVKNTVVKKITTILLCGVLCAGILVMAKAFLTNFTIQAGGGVVAEYIFTVTNSEDKPDSQKTLNYLSILYSNNDLSLLIKRLESAGIFAFNKLVTNWNQMADLAKTEWLKKHIAVQYLQGNCGRIFFKLKQIEVHDLNFLKKNGPLLLDSLMKVSTEYFSEVNPNTFIEISSRNFAFPKEIPVSKKNILVMYGIMGFFFGCLLSVLIVIFPMLRSYDENS